MVTSGEGSGAASDATVAIGLPDTRSTVEIARVEADAADAAVESLERKREKFRDHLLDIEQGLKDAKAAQKDAAKRLRDAEKGDE